VLSNSSKSVEHFPLKSGFHHEDVYVDLLAMLQFPHGVPVVLLDKLIGEANCSFNEFLQRSGQQFIDFLVIIVVVANAEEDVDVVPNGPTEHEGVNARMGRQRVVSQVLGDAELVVQQVGAFCVVKPIQHREPVLLPRVVLDVE